MIIDSRIVHDADRQVELGWITQQESVPYNYFESFLLKHCGASLYTHVMYLRSAVYTAMIGRRDPEKPYHFAIAHAAWYVRHNAFEDVLLTVREVPLDDDKVPKEGEPWPRPIRLELRQRHSDKHFAELRMTLMDQDKFWLGGSNFLVSHVNFIAHNHGHYTIFDNLESSYWTTVKGVTLHYLLNLTRELQVFAGDELATYYSAFINYIREISVRHPEAVCEMRYSLDRRLTDAQGRDTIDLRISVGREPNPLPLLSELAKFEHVFSRQLPKPEEGEQA